MCSIERHAVYRCYSDLGELLYVGESGELGKRLATHAQKAWFLQVRGITLEWYADEIDALKAERRAIHVEHPKYNIQHRNAVTLRPAKPRSPRSRRNGRGRTYEETRALVLAILRDEPDISGSEIGRRLGVQPGYGRKLKRTLAPAGAGGDS
jgi:hypothetical protein